MREGDLEVCKVGAINLKNDDLRCDDCQSCKTTLKKQKKNYADSFDKVSR